MWVFIPLLQIEQFLNSTFFASLVAIIVGYLAWSVYRKQKEDNKKDAANIILLEIKNAERFLVRAKENMKAGFLAADIFLMPTGSWDKYKYLFIRDLDRDEWDKISNFYNKSKLFDEAVSYNNSFFQKNEEQIRVNLQASLAKFSIEHANEMMKAKTDDQKKELQTRFEEVTNTFQTTYNQRQFGGFFYSPNKPLNDAKLYLESLDESISQTTIGTKLKTLAGLKE